MSTMSDCGDNYVYTPMNEDILEENDFIKVAPNEDKEFMEFDKEDDDTILFSTVQAQYPNATGLKYKGSSGAWRAIRAVDNVLNAPKGGWGNRVYCISANDSAKQPSKVEPTRKRSADTGTTDERQEHKRTKSSTDPLLKDLPVTGLSYKTTIEELKEYFETNYGELDLCEIKMDRSTGQSRGFGFIRFKDKDTARDCVNARHELGGRSLFVKIKVERQMKLFIGGLPRDTTKEVLEEYFCEFGELTDVYVPTPFRNFAFITYSSTEDGRKVVNRKNHTLLGSTINVEERKNRNDDNSDSHHGDRRDRDRDRGNSSRGNDRSTSSHRNSSSSSRDGGGAGYNNYSNSRDVPRGQQQGGGIPASNMDADLKTLLMHYLAAGN